MRHCAAQASRGQSAPTPASRLACPQTPALSLAAAVILLWVILPPPQKKRLCPGPNSGGPRRIPSVPPASPPRLRLQGCGAPGLPGPAPANRSSPHTPLRQPIPGGPAAPPPPPPGVPPPPGPRAPLGQPGVSSPTPSGREPQFPTRPFSLLPNQESPPPASSPRRSACSAGQRGPNPFPLRA